MRRRGGRQAVGRQAVGRRSGFAAVVLAAVAAVAAPIAGCTSSSVPPAAPALTVVTPTAVPGISKVMIIAEENETYERVVGSTSAPYLSSLGDRFGLATNMSAGYSAACPSLPGYLLLTSGSTYGICDDLGPDAHPVEGDNLYQQVVTSGRQWRGYAETMPSPCYRKNAGRYLVRHAPAPYYTSERERCAQWDLPSGTPAAGALHDDLVGGSLPALSFVTPDACDDMHGGDDCRDHLVARGDAWLGEWMQLILRSPDWTSGRLAVFVTWDEGSHDSNHIATMVVSPTTTRVRAANPWTHCSTLRTVEELLALPLLGCAASAPSMATAFALRPAG
jgi:phosphatidylinositol-3-phosphatase